MRILFIAPSAYLLGGVQDWLYMTVIGLRMRGHHVEVGVPDDFYHNGKLFNKHFSGIDAVFFRNRSGTNEGRIRSLKSFIENKESDIIVGVNIGNLFEAISRLGKNRQAKFVMTVHAIEHNYFADMKQYKALIDGVIVTNKLAEVLANKISGMDNSRIHYAPYGVNQKEKTIKQRLRSCPLRIAWIGRLEESQKRVSDIIGIIKNLDQLNIDYELGIAGDGPEKDRLKANMSTWINEGKVRFHGIVKKENVNDFYKNYHVLLITSKWETGPIVAWEAINSGLALVSSDYIGSKAERTLVHEKTALMFAVGDTVGAAKQVARLTDESLRNNLTSNAEEIVRMKYSIRASLDDWEKAFIEIKASEKKLQVAKESLVLQPGPAGRMEKYLGLRASEFIRAILPRQVPRNAGDEWPHSLQGIKDQHWILDYAEKLENST